MGKTISFISDCESQTGRGIRRSCSSFMGIFDQNKTVKNILPFFARGGQNAVRSRFSNSGNIRGTHARLEGMPSRARIEVKLSVPSQSPHRTLRHHRRDPEANGSTTSHIRDCTIPTQYCSALLAGDREPCSLRASLILMAGAKDEGRQCHPRALWA